MLHLLKTCRHLCLRTTIYKSNVATQALSSTARVHSGVAAAYDEYMFAYIKRCICERVGCIHEVDTSKVFVRRHDVQRILALDIHKVGQTSTRSDEDTLEAFSLELVDSYSLPNYAVGLELNAHLLQVLYLNIHDVIRQTELWNTIFQYAANLVQCLEHMHLVTLLRHVASKAES